MKKKAEIIGHITLWVIFLLLWGTRLEAEENMKKPSSYSETAELSETDKKKEEAWLLWKLERYDEAGKLIEDLLKTNAGDKDVCQLSVMNSLHKGDIKNAKQMIAKLERMNIDKVPLWRMKLELAVLEDNKKDALEYCKKILKETPNDQDINLTFAVTLADMGLWREAKKSFDEVFKNTRNNKKILREYRYYAKKYGDNIEAVGSFTQGQNSLWQYEAYEGVNYSITPRIRIRARIHHASYRQKALPGSDSLKESPAGIDVAAEFKVNEKIKVEIGYKPSFIGMKQFDEYTLGALLDQGPWVSKLEFKGNSLIVSPIDGAKKHAVQDQFTFNNNIELFKRINVGNNLDVKWIRVPSGSNSVNNKKDLGYIFSSEPYVDVRIFDDPVISLSASYKYAHWQRTFSDAEQVIGFFRDERAVRVGAYAEKTLFNDITVVASINRTYDTFRDVYSTFSAGEIEYWYNKTIRLFFVFEYLYGDSGLNGGGSSQTARGGVVHYF
ncbi:MAG: tetratricopeptide repeat protein [Candidatus Omnitrophica bacterium]|nr:tetratricopeptide repeat protein [Candidatus Omnitrophota bacterium]